MTRHIRSRVHSSSTWRTSSFSDSQGECIQVMTTPNGRIGVRDSKLADASPVLVFPNRAWRHFLVACLWGSAAYPSRSASSPARSGQTARLRG